MYFAKWKVLRAKVTFFLRTRECGNVREKKKQLETDLEEDKGKGIKGKVEI